ncbi:hypothetical protein DL769_001159 [Monosporascus sp. CRB-8-3]|nr:hypothetical protein DL769_001159 [Monosporascus sp. CRB-8-3]
MSVRSLTGRGFVQLGASRGSIEHGIPLQQVRSNASSTGARRPNQGGTFNSFTISESSPGGAENEKQEGFFRHGRRRAKNEEAPTRSDTLASDELSVNAMGRLYNKIIGFSVVTRYLIYIIPVGTFLAVPIIVIRATGNHHVQAGHGPCTTDDEGRETCAPGPLLFNLFVWIEAMWLSVWAGKLVAHLLPGVFMFLVGFVSAGTRKYATVLRALEVPISLFFWALASFFSFTGLFTSNFDNVSWVNTLKEILGASLVSSAVFLGEKAIVQLISITYHQRSFANRIKDSKREVRLLSLMYDASRTLFPMYSPEFEEEDIIINDSIERLIGAKKKKGHTGQKSVNPMALIAEAGGKVGRFGGKVTSIFGHVASEITGKQVFNPNSAHSIVVEALEKTRTSEALARRIWMSFVVEGKESLYPDDIREVLGPNDVEAAEECFMAIDADGNGDISLEEMIRKVVEIGKERKAISHSMQDIGQALSVFDNILLFVVLLIVIFVFLAFFQSSFITTLATAGTALLSLSFVFAVTTQEFLGSCIFLFVKHPYDVGDRVDIAGSSCEQLLVEKISLLYTVFIRIDRLQTVQVPNIVLNNCWIENVTRSQAMKEIIEVNVSYDTSFEDIELLRQEMENFVRHPDNARDFLPDLIINVEGIGDLDKLSLQIAVKHKSNWHNEAVRASRRNRFMCALTLALKRVPIYPPGGGGEELGGPTNPSYSVSVSDEIAAAAREKAAEEKEAQRMVPSKPAHSNRRASIVDDDQMRAAQEFSAVSPVTVADEVGYRRDDNTLRERRLGRRSNDLRRSDDMPNHLSLTKSQSVRGYRRAGDAVPQSPVGENTARSHTGGNAPGFQVTQHLTPFDEEAQTGGPNPFEHGEDSQRNTSQPSGHASTRPPVLGVQVPSHQAGARARGSTMPSNNPYQQR